MPPDTPLFSLWWFDMNTRQFSRQLSILHGLLHGSRMLIGAVHSLYLLKTGVLLNNLAFLQMVFSLTVLACEFPTGVLADAISRKLSVLVSCIFLAGFYLFCLKAPDMRFLITSEILYGLGLCFIYGALEGWITAIIREEYPNDADKINYFGHFRTEVQALSAMLAGPLEAGLVILWPFGFYTLYGVCAIIMLLFFIFFWRIPSLVQLKPNLATQQLYREHYKELFTTLRFCFRSRDALSFLGIMCLLAAVYQSVFHFWQPLFLNLSKQDMSIPRWLHHEAAILGIVFFSYSLLRYLSNYYVRIFRLSSFIVGMISAGLASILILVVTMNGQPLLIYVSLFAVFHGVVSLIETIAEAQFLRVIPPKLIATALSTISTCTRILSLGMLWLLATWVTPENLPRFFQANAILFVLIFLCFFYWEKCYATDNQSQNNGYVRVD